MKYYLSIFSLLLLSCGQKTSKTSVVPSLQKDVKSLEINVSRNTETLGIIFILTDRGSEILEDNGAINSGLTYTLKYAERFAQFKEHPTVIVFNDLIQKDLLGIGDFRLGLYFTSLPEFKRIADFDHKDFGRNQIYKDSGYTNDQRDSILDDLAARIKTFYHDAELEQFFTKYEWLYSRIEDEVRSSLISPYIIDTMKSFYNTQPNNIKYKVIPISTLFSGWGFGASPIQGDTIIYYQLLSNWADKPFIHFDSLRNIKTLGFDNTEYNMEFSIHEFGHSFVNFVREDSTAIRLISETAFLNFDNLKKASRIMGYEDKWATIFEEHLVRAGEIVILKKFGMNEFAKRKTQDEINKYKYVYLTIFIEELEKYNVSNNENLKEYFPKLIMRLKKIDKSQYVF